MCKPTKLPRFPWMLLSAAQDAVENSKIRYVKREEELKGWVKYDMIAPI